MTTMIRQWVQHHRYRAMVRQLRSLSSTELRALEIAPSEINHLAFEASRDEPTEVPPRLVTGKSGANEKN